MLYQTNALKNFCFTDSPLDREQKKQAIKQQAARLEKLQLLVKQSALPVIVLVEGWGTAGKGSRIASRSSRCPVPHPRSLPSRFCTVT